MSVRIICADVMDGLAQLADESVHCVVTSPPYFGLRDYGMAGQIGLEPTLDEYLAKMVAVFREVRRVLRDDGTLWLNVGDSYAGSGRGGHVGHSTTLEGTIESEQQSRIARGSQLSPGMHAAAAAAGAIGRAWVPAPAGLKQKDLMGVPWALAFALRADGWYLRQDIIWAKPNPMPESVRDRCTKSHEYIFILSKSARYYYDADAIAEPVAPASVERLSQPTLDDQAGSDRVPGKRNGPMKAVARKGADATRRDGDKWNENNGRGFVVKRSGNKARKPASARGVPIDTNGGTNGAVAGSVPWEGATANKRSVWTVTTQPFKEAHFATFPPALIEPCILAGCPQGGTVLDPFGGAGTTGLVADRLQRDAILIELNPAYAEMAKKRIASDSPLFSDVA